MKLFLILSALASINSFALNLPSVKKIKSTSPTDSILSLAEETGFAVNFKAAFPLVFDASNGGYQLENTLYWQSKQLVRSAASLDKTLPFCSLEMNSFWEMETPASATLPVKTYSSGKVLGRLSESKGFITQIDLDTSALPHINFTHFSCEFPTSNPKEATLDDVIAITGGAVEVQKSDSFAVTDDDLVIAQMFAENKAGLSLFKKAHKIGPILESAKYETVSNTPTPGHPNEGTSVVVYTITSLDCLGTDQCSGTVVWIATASTYGDGYSSETTFTNQVSHSPARVHNF